MAEKAGHEAKAAESFSQFLARILDQLSVSSWLPSAMLVLVALCYGALHRKDGAVTKALNAILGMGFTEVIVLVGLVIVCTVLTQAFEFEAIRLLEGYWSGGERVERLLSKRCAVFRAESDRLDEETKRLRVEAAKSAHARMMEEKSFPESWLDPLKHFADTGSTDGLSDVAAQYLKEGDWMVKADADIVRKYFSAGKRKALIPDRDHRILPTRLGNVLRSFEERVHRGDEGGLEGFIQRHLGRIPPLLLAEHDQFRSRLNLYCTMVFVFALGSGAASSLLFVNWGAALVCAGLSALLSLLSYRAAVSSAAGYGRALVSIRETLSQQETAGGRRTVNLARA